MQERKPVTKPLIALCLLSSRCPERVTVWRGGWCRTEREGAVGRPAEGYCVAVCLCVRVRAPVLSPFYGDLGLTQRERASRGQSSERPGKNKEQRGLLPQAGLRAGLLSLRLSPPGARDLHLALVRKSPRASCREAQVRPLSGAVTSGPSGVCAPGYCSQGAHSGW